MTEPFDPRAFQEALRTTALGRWLVYRPVTPTTMDLARREAAEGAPHGTLVLAEEQTAGRGRKGRAFFSPAGENLYFTLLLRLAEGDQARLPVAVPLAVCEACRAEGLEARIKWPNDVWVGERKLSGMLIDAEVTGGVAVAYPGIGVNVNGDPTLLPGLAAIATSLRRELGRRVAREALLARACNLLEEALEQDPRKLVARYRELSLVLGRTVNVSDVAGASFEAVAEDVTEDGALIVRRADGARETLMAAELSLRPL